MNKIVLTMASLRMMSGSIEIIAAILMLRLATVEKALLVNSGLALVGPLVLLATTTIGLVGIAEKLSYGQNALGDCGSKLSLYWYFKK